MNRFRRTVIGVTSFVMFATLFSLSDASAQNARRKRYTAQQRSEIRAMPILSRPNRPGHFYGNRVRKNAAMGPSTATASNRQVAASRGSSATEKSPTRTESESKMQTQAEPANHLQQSLREKKPVDNQVDAIKPAVTAMAVSSSTRPAAPRGR